jgi:hypothetical protein
LHETVAMQFTHDFIEAAFLGEGKGFDPPEVIQQPTKGHIPLDEIDVQP